uniref:Uncharacterized protein n=1 Tax=Oncorhynchus tshawytscha TaxID=74940 RepID=A0A8C8CCL5_ONCTS
MVCISIAGSTFSLRQLPGMCKCTLRIKNGNLHYCGFQVLAPQIFWAPTHIPSEARCSMLEAWRTRLEGLLGETPLSFTPSDSFDGGRGFQLKEDIQEKHAAKEFGLTVGTHSQIKAGV